MLMFQRNMPAGDQWTQLCSITVLRCGHRFEQFPISNSEFSQEAGLRAAILMNNMHDLLMNAIVK